MSQFKTFVEFTTLRGLYMHNFQVHYSIAVPKKQQEMRDIKGFFKKFIFYGNMQ